jgi:hypothetical protein
VVALSARVSGLRIFNAAPGTSAPAGSLTSPATSESCARRGEMNRTMVRMARAVNSIPPRVDNYDTVRVDGPLCSPNYTPLRTPEIEDVILFSGDGGSDSLNRPNAIITKQGGNRAHVR